LPKWTDSLRALWRPSGVCYLTKKFITCRCFPIGLFAFLDLPSFSIVVRIWSVSEKMWLLLFLRIIGYLHEQLESINYVIHFRGWSERNLSKDRNWICFCIVLWVFHCFERIIVEMIISTVISDLKVSRGACNYDCFFVSHCPTLTFALCIL
jgi:hypothetical protein